MTKVLMHFVTTSGTPLAEAKVEVRLTRSDYDEVISGIIMPRLIEGYTDPDGLALFDLAPCDTQYHVTVYDPITDTGLHYEFYVPVTSDPSTILRLQDLVVPSDIVLTPPPYDQEVLMQILQSKAVTLAARDEAKAAAIAAAASADLADDRIDEIIAARDTAVNAASTATTAKNIVVGAAADVAADRVIVSADKAVAVQAAVDAVAAAGNSIALAAQVLENATAAAASALAADASADIASAAETVVVAAEASAVTARNEAVAAKDITVAARDVATDARDTAVQKANQLASQLAAFNEIYIGKFAVAPTLDGNGNPLKVGAIYENTVEGKLYQWESDLAWHPYDEESQQQLNNAILSAQNAATYAGNALTSQNAAEASRLDALAYKNAANQSALDSLGSAGAASGSAADALVHRNAASDSAATATTKAQEAHDSAVIAQAAAEQATTGQVQSDWLEASNVAKAYIKNKPTLVPVATSGAKADVGLGNVDNTSDVNKPVSTAQQTALNLKANLTGAVDFGGPVSLPTAAAGNSSLLAANTAFVASSIAQTKSDLVNGAPSNLDTLGELAAAIGNDPALATNTAAALAARLRVDVSTQALTAPQKVNALTNLGISNVENKSASQILSEITAANIPALDFATKLINKPSTLAGHGINDQLSAFLTQASQSPRNIVNGLLVTTTIDYSVTEGVAWVLEVMGNAGSNKYPFDFIAQGLISGGSMIDVGGTSSGTLVTGLVALNSAGKLCFWWPRLGANHSFSIYVSSMSASGVKRNWAFTVTDVIMPVAATKVVSVPLRPVGFTNSALSADYNTVVESGVYRVDAGSSNAVETLGNMLIMRGGNSDSIAQIMASTTGEIYTRAGQPTVVGGAGAYSTWRKQINDSNIATYAPSLLGVGAYGTWTINITGTAATTSTAKVLDVVDQNASTILPTNSPRTVRWDYTTATSTSTLANYSATMTVMPYNGTAAQAGGPSYQMAMGGSNAITGTFQLMFRKGLDAAWGPWVEAVHTGNLATMVTKTSVGLSNVDNTSDMDKPVSTAQAAAIAAGSSSYLTGDVLTTARALTSPAWLPCDGGVYLQTSYPTLFALLGHTGMNRLPDPTTTIPPSTPRYIAASSDGVYIAASCGSALQFFKRSGNSLTKLSDPTATTNPQGISMTGDGVYLAVATDQTPYLQWYKRTADVWTKLANPTSPNGNCVDVGWSSDGAYLAIAGSVSPFITMYSRSGDTLTKLANPSVIPLDQSQGAKFSPDSTYLLVQQSFTPFLNIYKRAGTTFTKLTNPTSLPTGVAYGGAWSPDGTYMVIAHNTSPYITIYKRAGDVFTKLANPTELPSGNCVDISFAPDGNSFVVVGNVTPFIYSYTRNGDVFTKQPTPSNGVADSAWSCEFLGTSLVLIGGGNSPFWYALYNKPYDANTQFAVPSATSMGVKLTSFIKT